MGKPAVLLLTTLGIACSRPQPFVGAGTTPRDFQEAAVTAVINGALTGEAAGQATDSLFITPALVVVNGRTRSTSPRFAGIGQGGQVAITSSQLEIRSTSSWGVVDYRWETSGGVAREGRATFVLTQLAEGKWRIQHLHSSSPQ